MPFTSQAQARLFFAAAKGRAKGSGPSPAVAGKFIRDTEHQALKGLPQYVKPKIGKPRAR